MNSFTRRVSVLLTIFCLTMVALAGTLQAQELNVTGKVTGDEGEPIPGVNVLVSGTSSGVITDIDGNYSINVPSSDTKLTFSYVGYQTTTLSVNNRSSINVEMAADIQQLSEVVVIGYGEQSRRDVTSAIASVNGEDLENVPMPTIDGLIQGRAAGVSVTNNSGAPGSGITVRIRGNSSINAGNDPLYVIDGVPVRTENFDSPGFDAAQNPLSDINPDDIASIEILKDAAATSIYGARAANGVVLITTKRGRTGSTRITLNTQTGLDLPPPKMPLLSGPDHKTYWIEAKVNEGIDPLDGSLADYYSDPTRPDFYRFENDTDWQEEIRQNGIRQNYTLSMRGGNQETRFAISGGYYDQTGVVKNTDFTRYSARVNVDHEVSNSVRLGNSLNISRSLQNRASGGWNRDPTVMAFRTHSWWNKWKRDPETGEVLEGLWNFDTNRNNPAALAELMKNERTSNRVIGNIFGEWDIIDGMTFRASYGLDYGADNIEYFMPDGFVDGDRTAQKTKNESLDWIADLTLSYNKSFGSNSQHNISALAGYSAQQSRWDQIFGQTSKSASALVQTLTGSQVDNIRSDISEWGITSFFGRINYSGFDKYLVSLNFRRDGSSRFGDANKYGNFPSASLGWRISQEPFLQDVDFIDDLKFRASFGVTGNQNIGNFNYIPLYEAGANYAGQPGIAQRNVGVSNLSWEESQEQNYGFDLTLLNGRLTLVGDYYIKTTEDLILNRPLPKSSGFSSSTQNFGSIQNKGWEFQALGTILQGNLNWNINLNLARNRNRVISLPGGNEIRAIQGGDIPVEAIAREGEVLGTFIGWVMDGVFSTTEDTYLTQVGTNTEGNPVYDYWSDNPGSEVATDNDGNPLTIRHQTAGGNRFQAGDVKFRDIDGDGVITEEDRTFIGDGNPDVYGGFNNNFTWKGLELSFFFQFSIGNDGINGTRAQVEELAKWDIMAESILRRWRKEGDVVDMPRAYGDRERVQNYRFSTRWVEDATYLRLKTITLAYNLPNSFLQNTFINNARLFFTGVNLLTATDYLGMDPEFNSSNNPILLGLDSFTYPQPRTFTLGVNVGF